MLVTLAGLGAGIRGTWDAVLPLLDDLDPVTIPIPGMGGCPVPDGYDGSLPAVLVALDRATHDREPFDLLGHSFGGSVAIAFAARWPARIRRLMVAEPNLAPDQGVFSGQVVRWTEAAFVAHGHGSVVRALELAARRGDTYPEFAISVAASDPLALHRAAMWLRATDFAAIARTLACPRLFIGGDGADLAGAAPLGFEVREMPGTGHVMMRDDPARFAMIVREWLEDDPRTPSS